MALDPEKDADVYIFQKRLANLDSMTTALQYDSRCLPVTCTLFNGVGEV